MDGLLEVVSIVDLLRASMKMPIGAGRVVARLYIAFAFGLFGLNCLHGGMVGGGVP